MKKILTTLLLISTLLLLFVSCDGNVNEKYLRSSRKPLCFTALTDETGVILEKEGSPYAINLQYSTDGRTWSDYYIEGELVYTANEGYVPLAKAGDKVYFKATATNSDFNINDSSYYHFVIFDQSNSNVSVNGDIMSLLDSECMQTSIPTDYCFTHLFSNCIGLKDASDLILSATKLTENCYYGMFVDCISLTAAPVLNATTLAKYCYAGMFQGCNTLETAPVLNATTLEEGCYNNMFYGCSMLNSVTCYATDISAEGCTNEWLVNVSESGSMYVSKEANWSSGPSGIPEHWTKIPITHKAFQTGHAALFSLF